MGREGGGRAGEEAEEVEGRHRGAGEGAGVARTAVGMRHHPQVARREATGESQKWSRSKFYQIPVPRLELSLSQ